MRWLCLFLVLLSLNGCAKWNTNKALYVASTALLIVDWGQTRYFTQAPERYKEENPLYSSKHPSLDEIDRYHTTWIGINTAMYFILPEEWQTYWFSGVCLVQVGAVSNNLVKFGAKFNWGM